MLPRSITFLALLAACAAPLAGRADDGWNDDTNAEWTEEGPASDGYGDLNDQGSVNMETFQGALSPYGEWVDVGGYGRVWRPHAAAGWRPYYYGRWEWTNEGWLWVSDEPWGWAAYHYGRWTYDSFYGWVWVPGYQWAPAWVAWRYSGDVVGWAPLGPGVSVYVSNYPFVDSWWTFVPCTSFVGYPVYSVAYAPHYTRRYFYDTAPAPPRPAARPVPGGRPVAVPAWGGPAPRTIELRTGRPVTPVRVVAAPNPGAARGRPGVVEMYRPGGARPAPTHNAFGPDRARGGAPVPPGRGRVERFSGADPGRGPGAYPAPGRAERLDDRRGWSPPAPPQRSDDRRGGFGPPAQSRGDGPRGGWSPPARESQPPQRNESRGFAPPQRSEGGGGGRSSFAPPRSSGGGGGGGSDSRPHPAPARDRGDHR